MTKAEFAILVKGMKAVYGDPKFLPDADAIMIWYEYFKDEDYMIVQAAIQKYIANSEFAPTVAGIRKCMVQITAAEDDEMSEGYAWSLVYKAICNSNYCSQEEFDKLPEICQKAVGHPENLRAWAQSNKDEVTTVIHSNFLRGFRAEKERQKQMLALPVKMREQIEKITAAHTPMINKEVEYDD